MLRGVSSRPAAELEPAMYRCIETPDGPALAQTDFEPFHQTVDLVRIAIAVQEVIEADAYRVSDLTVATDLPPVWLTSAAGEGLEAALHGVRACVSISAQLDPERAATASGPALHRLPGRSRERDGCAAARRGGAADEVA